MKKFQSVKISSLFASLLVLSALGCETPKKNEDFSIAQDDYTQLDQANLKDKEFYEALEKSLSHQGSLLSVWANIKELNLYREGKRPYPTNYRYTLKANPRTSLEEIKRANLNIKTINHE